MPPRKTIDKGAISKAAFDIVREAGWEALTARSLAKKLKSSTMPLYSSHKSMDEIKGDIRIMAAKMLHEYQRQPYTADSLLNGAIGYVTFADEEKQLFRFLFMEKGQSEGATGSWPTTSLDIPFDSGVDIKKIFLDLSDDAIKLIIERGWIFTHGLAMMVNSGIIPFQKEEIHKLLLENGIAQTLFVLNNNK